ncbi:Hypothetical predicted protein, partial [Marmota monax]
WQDSEECGGWFSSAQTEHPSSKSLKSKSSRIGNFLNTDLPPQMENSTLTPPTACKCPTTTVYN